MSPRVIARLARVSNLPTVATNVLCGFALAGREASVGTTVQVIAGMSSLYAGGMFLNDAFDHRYDRLHRPERPIPSSAASVLEVLAGGVALLAVGVLLLAVSPRSLALTLALAAVIVVYDAWHKQNRAAPLLMGTCRALVYLGAAAAAGGALSVPVVVAAAIACGYVMLLTAWSRSGGRHVGTLVAGISLLDAAMIASTGRAGLAALAVGGFMLTRWLQRWVSGT